MTATVNASTSAGVIVTSDTSGALALQSNGTTALTTSGANLTTGGVVSFQATTLPAAGTASIFNRSSDSTMYLQAATGGGINLLDGSQNSMANLASSSVTFLTGNVARMTINSSGYVTTPYKPAFQVYGTSLTGTTYLGGTTGLNVGSFFNTSTGIFTAPVAGNYLFSFALTTADANSQFINIAKNGSLYAGNMLQYNISYLTGSQTLIIPLAANDTVNAAVRDVNYAIYNARFCGYLLG